MEFNCAVPFSFGSRSARFREQCIDKLLKTFFVKENDGFGGLLIFNLKFLQARCKYFEV